MVETTLKISDSTLLLMLSVPTELYACVTGFRAHKCEDGTLDVTFIVTDLVLFATLWKKVEHSEAASALTEMIGDWTSDGLDT